MLNDIIVPRPGGKVTANSRNTDARWDYNLYPVAQSVLVGPHDLVADPRFVSIRPDLREADFRLQSDSPALNRGTKDLPQPTDLAGKKRPRTRPRISVRSRADPCQPIGIPRTSPIRKRSRNSG